MLTGKVAVVTGGSRGIGRAICEKFARLGCDIAVIYAGNTEKAAETVEICESLGVKAKSYKCDVSDFNAVKETVAQIKKDFKTVNILVNNAGITKDGLLAMMKEDDFDKVIASNLKGTFNMIRHTSSFFIRNKGGAIINISSVAGLMGNAGQANYAASKAGIVGLTKTVAREFASKGVTCNAIAPGFIATDMTESFQDNAEMINAMIPLGHMGSVEDIANTAAFLAESPYITGEVIRVDGGTAM